MEAKIKKLEEYISEIKGRQIHINKDSNILIILDGRELFYLYYKIKENNSADIPVECMKTLNTILEYL